MSDKPITPEQYEKAMRYKEWLEKELERTVKITRSYVYQWESERVQERKKQSIMDNNKIDHNGI